MSAADTWPRYCVAPIEDVGDRRIEEVRVCGRLASTSRLAEGLDCPLCAAHAAELDAEQEQS